MRSLLVPAFLALLPAALVAQQPREVFFASPDGGRVFANLYGEGDHAVILAHGAVFDKESWDAQARRLSAAGLRVLAIDFRGYGKSRAGSKGAALELDLLAAIDYLREIGAARISLAGGSMGGAAVARAAALAEPGALDALILLAPAGVDQPAKLQGRKLFLVSKGDGGYRGVMRAHQRAADPKRLVVLEGSAHAQHLFKTPQGSQVLAEMLAWLTQ